ncbi:MAG TPA: DUF3300 domain-containing protein [Desulfuromonadaceae bacterium]
MKTLLITITAVVLAAAGLAPGRVTWADDGDLPGAYEMQQGADLFTPDELDTLLAPIALYPDPLIAQILPAATFIDQIDEAARYVRQYGGSARIDDQPWDVSVKAVAHYPDVLFMMDQKYDWSVSLGQAFASQEQDVMDSIQRLRDEAQEAGTLVSTPQQQVIEDSGGIISIVPAAPDVIYVPQYDPLVVYVTPAYPSYGFVTFGTGFTLGVWLNRDCDWRRHRVFYHGWRGGGWIGRARPYVHDRRHMYINNIYRTTTINRRVMQHDTLRFREDLRRDVQLRRERGGLPTHRQGMPPRHALQPAAPRVQAPRPATTATRHPQPQNNRDIYRGRQPRGAQPAPFSGYGGYGSRGEARTYRERGQSSRQNIRPRQPVPVRPSAPAQRQGSPGGRPSGTAPAGHGGGGGQRPQR